MIVFKNKADAFRTEDWLNRIEHYYTLCVYRHFEHELTVKLLIECGEFECAVIDSACKVEDTVGNIVLLLRALTVSAGKIFVQSWEKGSVDSSQESDFHSLLMALKEHNLPDIVHFGVSEGFAYYGLFPETYLETTKKFAKTIYNAPITIIGLRTIGTTLSAIVSATLTYLGHDNTSFTVRPKGDPFNRTIRFSKELALRILDKIHGYFIITDEGPGLSGSSFGGTAQFLSEQGVQDKNIFYFPSWEPDQSMMNSKNARDHWERHKKMSTSFESVWIDSRKVHERFNAHSLIDISAGMWRDRLNVEDSEFPPVHPHHERRKYLVVKDPVVNKPATLIKFAGLGRYGEKTCQRAAIMEKSDSTLPVKNCANGFIEYDLIENNQRCIKEISTSFLSSAAKYVSFLRNTFPVSDLVAPEDMVEMVNVNILESIGDMFLNKTGIFNKYIDNLYLKFGTAVDGRMQLFKWLHYDNRYIKTDHTDHHCDQFFPGNQDVAWDIAGGIIEWNLNVEYENYFVNAYAEESGDISVWQRVHPNKIAYCAFKVGISRLFGESLSGTSDGDLFVEKYQYYRDYLLKLLT